MNLHLTDRFLDELFKSLFLKKSMIEVVRQHLKYQYIPKSMPEYKNILQSIFNQWDLNNKLPSYGVISQQYEKDVNIQNTLSKIKNSEVVPSELLINQLSEFIKEVKFQLVFEQTFETYEKGDKETAIKIFTEGATEISEFNLKKDSNLFMGVFRDFKKIQEEKQLRHEVGEDIREKIPIGIDILDNITDGGVDKTDIALWIMRSGVGKSTALKWTGMYACRLGYNVLHFQLEGSQEEAFDKYTQTWTACSYPEIKWGNIPENKIGGIEKALDSMIKQQKDIEIYSFEKFGSASMVEMRSVILEYEKIYGKFPDLIIWDSLDLAITGINKKIDFDPNFKKERLQKVAQLMKDTCVEFKCAGLTATQTSNIGKDKWNDPNFVITREHTEGDRTLVKPFSNVFTGNQTNDEKKKGLMRLHIEKLRNYDTKDQTYPIFSAYKNGRFYSRQKTLQEFSEMYQDED